MKYQILKITKISIENIKIYNSYIFYSLMIKSQKYYKKLNHALISFKILARLYFFLLYEETGATFFF
jgi:hypothetical protein